MSKDIAMEDVKSIGLDAMKVIQEKLKEFGITLTDEQEDAIYVPMVDAIEKVAGCPDYRSHN
jgi:DNA-directed RNA polymerase alpha subunit